MLLERCRHAADIADCRGLVQAWLDTRVEQQIGQRLMSAVHRRDEGRVAHRVSCREQARVGLQQCLDTFRIARARGLHQIDDRGRERFIPRRPLRPQIVGNRINQHRPQALARGMQPPLDRGHRHLEERGDLLHRIPGDVEERHRGPLVLGQVTHGVDHVRLPFLLAAGPAEAGHYECAVEPFGIRLERNGRDRLPASDAIALLEDDPPEPSGEGRRLAKLRQRSIGFEERLLRRVLRELEVVEHRVAVADRHVLKAADHGGERVRVPFPRPSDHFVQRVHLQIKSHLLAKGYGPLAQA